VALFFIVTPFGGTELAKQIEGLGKLPIGLKFEDLDYHRVLFNVSNISDKELRKLYRWAYIRFYFNPVRIIRILLRKPMLNDTLKQIMTLFRAMIISSNRNKKLKLNSIDLELNRDNTNNEYEDS
jgi:hypothetical protein